MNLCLDTKISFLSGTTFTVLMTAPLYELWFALLLGLVGGFGGVVGKEVFYFIREKLFDKKRK